MTGAPVGFGVGAATGAPVGFGVGAATGAPVGDPVGFDVGAGVVNPGYTVWLESATGCNVHSELAVPIPDQWKQYPEDTVSKTLQPRVESLHSLAHSSVDVSMPVSNTGCLEPLF